MQIHILEFLYTHEERLNRFIIHPLRVVAEIEALATLIIVIMFVEDAATSLTPLAFEPKTPPAIFTASHLEVDHTRTVLRPVVRDLEIPVQFFGNAAHEHELEVAVPEAVLRLDVEFVENPALL